MALGPFTSYSPPGIYVRTLAEANVSNVVAGLRLPVIIGVGQEELETLDLELVRGSSATVDQKITAEDVSLAWVVDATNPQNLTLGAQDGTRTQFRVRNFPITTGEAGRVANDIRYVMVTVNGLPVAVSSVQGAKGLVTLQVPTQSTDVVRCTYNFHRGDTVFTDDVSSQVSVTTAQLTTPAAEPYNVVLNTTDKFILSVDGAKYSIPLTPNTGTTAAQLKSQIDAVLIPGLTTTVFVDNNGLNRVQFNSAVSLRVEDGNANGTLGFTNGAQTARNNVFRVYQRPMVDGSSGGVTTTDPSKCVVKVNNIQVVPTSVDGTNGLVTLASPPAAGSIVTIQYYSNTWQDTFDYLPNTMVTSVIRAGISAQRSDYIQGQDFVISNPTPDVSIINWGTGFSVSPTRTTVGATPFDKRQIIPTLIDQQMFMTPCTRVTDTSVIPARTSDTEFLLPEIPTVGNGRNSILGTELYNSVTNGRVDLVNNRPDLVKAYSGRTLRDALNRGVLAVVAVEGSARKITLKNPVPPDHNVYATFYYNKVADDTYLMTCSTPGAVGAGQYNVYSTIHGENLYQVKFGTKSGLAETVQWPRGVETIPDALHTGAGSPVSETVTVTFGSDAATNAVYTNKGAGPWSFYASSNTWVTKLNGTDYTSNLNAAAKGYLVSKRVKLVGGNVSSDGLSATAFSASNNAFNITVDGVDVAVSLGTGTKTPAAIVTAINSAIDAVVPFSPGPNNLAATYQISGGDVFFVIHSFSTPASLPGGFDHKSYVRVRQGTAETLIGYSTFQRADGTPKAINKAATVIGSLAGPFNIVAGVNDSLQFRVNGVDYTVSLTSIAGTSVAASTVVTTINATPGLSGVASVGTLDNLNKIRLTSQTNDAQSQILMGNGTANTLFGFTQGQLVTQTLVDPQEVADVLMSTANFTTDGVAYVSTYNGQKYITIESLTTGATGSSVAFTASVQSAFNRLTGVNITTGVDGDVGEDALDNFTVTSSNANGSSGKGTPGQTYTDARTGLRFTVLPSSTGSYTSSGSFTMLVSQTFDVNPAVPTYAVPGLETIVSDTFGVGLGDISTLQTFNPGGLEPANGDTYFVSYRYMKQEFDTRIFQQLKTIEANFGRTSAENRVTLGAYMAILNGALLVAIKQVLKAPNTNQATDTTFNQAIADLTKPLPGNVRPDIIVPLATSTAVYSFLTNHCETMSNIRFQSERMGFLGFAPGTTPTSVQTIARSLNSNRMVVFYPDSGVIPLTDEQGTTFETLVDGSFFAAAAAGAVVSPAVDVATPYTRRRILGFSRIPRVLDPVEANQVAVAGVVVLEDLQSVIRIRQGFTTRMESPLTRLPTVTQIADFVQQQSRTTLDAFVGSKFLASRTNEVEVSMTAMLKQLIQAEIIGAFTGVSASVDSSDRTVMQFEAAYQPIFPLLYIVVTFNLRAQIGTA